MPMTTRILEYKVQVHATLKQYNIHTLELEAAMVVVNLCGNNLLI